MNESVVFDLYCVVSGVTTFLIGRKFRHLSWGKYLLIGVPVVMLFAFGWILISVLL